MVGDHCSSKASLGDIRLIDFGLSTRFLDQNGNHIQEHTKVSKGNMAFCSKYKMVCTAPSRRDDIISLLHMLLYLLKGQLPFLNG